MLFRIVLESLARRRRRKLLSVAAITLGMAVTAAVATMALDVGDKVSRELRSFGANLAMTPAADGLSVAVGGVDVRPAGAGAFLPETALASLKRIFWRNNIVAFAPFLYVPANIADRPVTVTGTWFKNSLRVDKSEIFVTGLAKLHPAWDVVGAWPSDDSAQDALVGSRLAERLHASLGQTLVLRTDAGAAATLVVRGILTSGGPEDDQIMAPLARVQHWVGLEGKVRRVEISALTKPEDAFARSDVTRLSGAEFDRWYCSPYANSIAYQIEQAIPEAQVKPIYRVADTEGRILQRIGVLMAVLAGSALVAAALAVASLMLATVVERRAEIGLFKSLGASDARVAAIFLFEACALGALGGSMGYFLGSLLAWRLALLVFGVAISIHWVILPLCLALALVVTVAGSVLPVVRAARVAPALALHE